jgi:hypothetical protein
VVGRFFFGGGGWGWVHLPPGRVFCCNLFSGCGRLCRWVRHLTEIEDLDMPTTHHSAAAERHLQAAHAHQAAAASHNMNDHLGAHEQSLLAMEHAREAHRLSEEEAEAAKVLKVSKELETR